MCSNFYSSITNILCRRVKEWYAAAQPDDILHAAVHYAIAERIVAMKNFRLFRLKQAIALLRVVHLDILATAEPCKWGIQFRIFDPENSVFVK